jgi:glycosyltransferase involved in cell wall biosynthesis
MRVLCILYGGADHPSSRFRVLQHLGRLRAAGIEPDVYVAKRRGPIDLLRLARRARASDAVLIQKKLFALWKLPALAGPAPILFDMDDAYFAVSPYEAERHGAERAERRARSRRRRLEALLARCRAVIAGNRFLGEYAARFAREVAVLPTAVDLGPYSDEEVARARALRAARRDGPRLGWIGSRPSLRYLAALADPLRRVCARLPGSRLVQICNEFIDLPGVPSEKRAWNAAREAADLLDLDVGLMPLDDSPFSRGKCGLKILQYHAAGLPVVCSPVGANLEIVTEGETGLFARDGGEWEERLSSLLADPARGAALGERGRRAVRERFEATRIGDRLAELLRSAVA